MWEAKQDQPLSVPRSSPDSAIYAKPVNSISAAELVDFITVENTVAVKARMGYAIDRVLLTGHVGAVYATTNVELTDWGWVAGIDYAVTDNITVGCQYTPFGSNDFDGTVIDAKIDALTAHVASSSHD